MERRSCTFFYCCAFSALSLATSTTGAAFFIGKSARSDCYGELGCFSTEGFYDPKRRFINVLPWKRQQIQTSFLFYAREIPDAYDRLFWNSPAEELKLVNFDPGLETKIIVHGYLQVPKPPDVQINTLKNAILKAGPYNLIIVDWSKGSITNYVQASANTRVVGAEIALLINKLQDVFGVRPETVHILGHSLGSHIAGYAGERLNRLGRITALDPADPFFQGMPANIRIDDSDAIFVDGIHSDGGPWLPSVNTGLGMIDPVGHIDFYPNGGVHQPGCSKGLTLNGVDMKSGTIKALRDIFVCLHDRAFYFLADALLAEAESREDPGRCRYVGYACSSYEDFLLGRCADCGPDGSACAVFGFAALRSKGVNRMTRMFFKTLDRAPFCLYHYNIVVHLGELSRSHKGKFELLIFGDYGSVNLELGTSEESLTSQKTMTFLATTASRVGTVEEASLLFVSSEEEAPAISVASVEVFYMNNLTTTETKKSLTVRLCPTENEVNGGGRLDFYRCPATPIPENDASVDNSTSTQEQ